MTDLLDFIVARQSESPTKGALSMWTIYDRPADFPEGYVARRYEATGGGPVATHDVLQGDLEALRDAFYRCGLVCLTRNEEDHPSVVETWL